MAKLPLAPTEVLGLVRELRASAKEDKPLAVAGAGELAGALQRELARGGVASARARRVGARGGGRARVRARRPRGRRDLEVFKRAQRRARADRGRPRRPAGARRQPDPPYALAENVVRVPAGSGFPMDEIARAIARNLGEHGDAARRAAAGAAGRRRRPA